MLNKKQVRHLIKEVLKQILCNILYGYISIAAVVMSDVIIYRLCLEMSYIKLLQRLQCFNNLILQESQEHF